MGFAHSNIKKSEKQLTRMNTQKPIANASFARFSSIKIHDPGEPIYTIDSEQELVGDTALNNCKFLDDSSIRFELQSKSPCRTGILKNGENKKSSRIFNEEAKVVRFNISKSVPSHSKGIRVKKRKIKALNLKYQKTIF